MEKSKKRKLLVFLALCLLGLLLINLTLIGAYIVLTKYGDSFKIYAGENYVVNIPFLGLSKNPTICGTAEKSDGTLLKNITVIVKYEDNNTILGQNVTGTNGKYCITLPEISSYEYYDLYIQYDNVTSTGENITLGSNDYSFDFDSSKIYSKSSDQYAFLVGTIANQDAQIDNGRFEINLQYWPANSSERYEVFDYRTYHVNIAPRENYDVLNSELNVSWEIPSDADIGRYKFYVKTSFNTKERTSSVYFNITA